MINAGNPPNPYGMGQQVEYAKLRPEQSATWVYAQVRAAKHVGRYSRQLEELNRGHRHGRPHRYARDLSRHPKKSMDHGGIKRIAQVLVGETEADRRKWWRSPSCA
jgi:hypothetical protein